MSLFDLQDVRIAIGSIATLDLPMVVDLIRIYGLKGPYRTLTTTNWFLQALSVIPRGSWGDVARRFYHDPLGKSGIVIPEPQCRRRRRHRAPPPLFAGKSFPANLDEENPSAPISSGLLVHADEGIPYPVVDLIDDIYRRLPSGAYCGGGASLHRPIFFEEATEAPESFEAPVMIEHHAHEPVFVEEEHQASDSTLAVVQFSEEQTGSSGSQAGQSGAPAN
ncbi:hypothetical protein F511_31916 [Dorcoceras hygrometricum]|uniref:Uncharacterized protein n=1 Tax=Dorcoceras hygrometricum TaxID=472368 RepID=A0A2Z7BCX9_9LAMI|nr:hypothetical protein F511_31916 [Dorcoceras hygrometricum]